MTIIIQAQHVQKKTLRLYFSDNSWWIMIYNPQIDRQTELVIPLNDESFFKQFFRTWGVMLA